jgi:Zn-dependent membrane protease YugP
MFMFHWSALLLIPGLLLGLWAQKRVVSTFRRYSGVPAGNGMTGRELARRILNSGGLNDVPVEAVPGQLSDHYDPVKRVVRLSEPVYGSASVAALGVAAHECGHALQHQQGYAAMRWRWALLKPAGLGSTLGPWLVLGGFMFGQGGRLLVDIGIALFTCAVLFQIVTLPVEFNASRRAVAQLQAVGVVAPQDVQGVREVLNAAGLTYVAAAASAILSLVQLLILRRERE